jgi:hypothetical protein
VIVVVETTDAKALGNLLITKLQKIRALYHDHGHGDRLSPGSHRYTTFKGRVRRTFVS